MNKYIFILGNNQELSTEEIAQTYPELKIVSRNNNILIGETDNLDCQKAIQTLGGTIKIGKIISTEHNEKIIIDELKNNNSEGKIKFGLSFYGINPNNLGMSIKKQLKSDGLSSRLVTSKEKSLSAVVISKNKVQDFMILPNIVAKTCGVQDFEGYSKRDYDRPKSDAISGMLPPKLARMMLNLSTVKSDDTVLDPFCGSGTVLMEAAMLNIKNIIGSDISDKAVEDSKINFDWLEDAYNIDCNIEINKLDARKLTSAIKPKSIDAIVTEGYLGPPIKGRETSAQIENIISELESLYVKSFTEFQNVLKPNGRVVIVRPSWHLDKEYNMNTTSSIEKLGFKKINTKDLIYKREDQKVWRYIEIWQK